MAVNLGRFEVDPAVLDDLLHDPEGPVGRLILDLSERAAVVAKASVHVMPGTPRSGFRGARSTAVRPPGTTKDSIEVHYPERGSKGGMFGGVDTIGLPTIFLEPKHKYKSVQMYDRYPFMTTGLESLVGTI